MAGATSARWLPLGRAVEPLGANAPSRAEDRTPWPHVVPAAQRPPRAIATFLAGLGVETGLGPSVRMHRRFEGEK
jgi:hypothetical protein